MMNKFILAALVMVSYGTSASEVVKGFPVADEESAGVAKVGLLVDAETAFPFLSAGGGYELTCDDSVSSWKSQHNDTSFSLTLSNSLEVKVPSGLYHVDYPMNMNNWVPGNPNNCKFSWKAVAATDLLLTFSFGTKKGLDVTYTPATSEYVDAKDLPFIMTKPTGSGGGGSGGEPCPE